jgi:hypothetical protein
MILNRRKPMSFTWRKVGSFDTAAEAEDWCRRLNIAMTDRRIDNISNGVELSIRDNVVDIDREDPRAYSY